MNKISFFNANKTESITFERFGTEVKFEHIEYENDLPVSYFTNNFKFDEYGPIFEGFIPSSTFTILRGMDDCELNEYYRFFK